MAFWANLLGYQIVWFAVVWSAGRNKAWIGILACVAFISWQWSISRVRKRDIRALIAAFVCGLVIDGVLATSGLLRYASPYPAASAPLWIVMLWGAFAMTMNHSMRWFSGRPVIAVLFAAIGGPLAYLGAARAFGAVVFPVSAWPTLLVLSLAWAIVLPLLLRIAHGSSAVLKVRDSEMQA